MLIMTRDLKAPEIGLVIEIIGNPMLKRKINCSLYSIIFVIKFKKKNYFTENLKDMKEKGEEVEAVVIVGLLIVIGIEVSLL